MRTFVILSFLCVVLTTTLAAPPSHHVPVESLRSIQNVHSVRPNGLVSDIVGIVKQLKTTIKDMESAVSSAVKKLEEAVGGDAGEFLKEVERILKESQGRAQEVVKGFVDALPSTPVDQVRPLIEKTLQELNEVVKWTIEEIVKAADELSESAKNDIKVILDQLRKDIEGAMRPLVDLIKKLISNPIFVELLEQLQTTVSRIEDAVQVTLKDIGDILKSEELVERVVAVVENALTGVKGIIGKLVEDLEGATSINALKLVKQAGKDLSELVERAAKDIVQVAESLGEVAVEDIQAIVKVLVGEVKSAVQDLVKVILKLIKE